ncbi:hypothetical protein GCM10009836_49800 [Pseudonocardia ailaonensis]|uniref:DUF4190 domain-containing protein n=1 Tax=Pseudonocardia ailaonensis TaxID=367279 RepID=A0ABN2NCT0_9PSEU
MQPLPIGWRARRWDELTPTEQAVEWQRWRYSVPPPYIAPTDRGAAGNPLAYAGVAVSVVAFCLCWVPFIGFLTAVTGLGVSMIGYRKAAQVRMGEGVALGGMIANGALAALAVVFTIAILS